MLMQRKKNGKIKETRQNYKIKIKMITILEILICSSIRLVFFYSYKLSTKKE